MRLIVDANVIWAIFGHFWRENSNETFSYFQTLCPLFFSQFETFRCSAVKYTFLKSHFNYPFTNFFQDYNFVRRVRKLRSISSLTLLLESLTISKKKPHFLYSKRKPFFRSTYIVIVLCLFKTLGTFMSGGLSKCYLVVLLYVRRHNVVG